MSRSPNLSMPFIMPAQAQKHVTHNEAIELLDALVQLRISTLNLSEPPLNPFEGQIVAIGSGAVGAFEGREGDLACHYGNGWMFLTPRNGFCAWVDAQEAMHVYQDGVWRLLTDDGSAGKVEGLGINAPWDSTNRLSAAAPATLLSHEGSGHQLKINKAAETDTASLVFQTGFSGRAEFGLAGEDDFSMKVSTEGSSWTVAFSVDAESGKTSFAAIDATRIGGEAIQATPDDFTAGRLMRADWGYGRGNVVGAVSQEAGSPTGAIIESGNNEHGYYVRWADGTQECWGRIRVDVTSTSPQLFEYPMPFVGDRESQSSSFSHLSGAPNNAILWRNIRAAGHGNSILFICLLSAGTSSDPNSFEETMGYRIIGRWF